MSLVRLLPAWLHAVADYAVAITLIAVALLVGGATKAVAAGVVIGAVVLVVSMLTRYPLGVIKVLPFQVHSAGDYLAAVLLVAAPFALGFSGSDRGLTIVYIAAGVAVLGVSLITNYQYGPRPQPLKEDSPVFDPRAATPPTPAPSLRQPEPRGAESWRSEREPAPIGAGSADEPASGDVSWRTARWRPEPRGTESWRSEPSSNGAAPVPAAAADEPWPADGRGEPRGAESWRSL